MTSSKEATDPGDDSLATGRIVTTSPLFDYDPISHALIEPEATQDSVKVPLAAVACFFPESMDALTSNARIIMELPSRHPLWEIEYAGQKLALFYPGMGAPLAACTLERVIAAGCRIIIACGSAGAVHERLTMAHDVVIVTSAVRDEGTSYHYLPPALQIEADPVATAAMAAVLDQHQVPYLCGRTWTTDAIFRETPNRVARRRSQGCITVEMESSALLAVASFRGIIFGQLLYAHDDLTEATWRQCDWEIAVPMRELLIRLAAESAISLTQHAALAASCR
jgi:uridine phosphorylase